MEGIDVSRKEHKFIELNFQGSLGKRRPRRLYLNLLWGRPGEKYQDEVIIRNDND